MKRKILLHNFVVPILASVLIIFFIINVIFPEFTCKISLYLLKDDSYSMIITKKYIDSTNHNYETLILSDGHKSEKYYPSRISLYYSSEIGDSVIKKRNDYNQIIKKKNGDSIIISPNCLPFLKTSDLGLK